MSDDIADVLNRAARLLNGLVVAVEYHRRRAAPPIPENYTPNVIAAGVPQRMLPAVYPAERIVDVAEGLPMPANVYAPGSLLGDAQRVADELAALPVRIAAAKAAAAGPGEPIAQPWTQEGFDEGAADPARR